MDFNSIINAIEGQVLTNQLIESIGLERPSKKVIEKEIKSKTSDLLTLMSSNNTKKAQTLALALIIFHPEKSLTEMRRIGVFRSSKYKFKTNTAKSVIQSCMTHKELLHLTTEQTNFLESTKNLLNLGAKAKQINEGLIQIIKNRKNLIIKTLLANIEILFATRFTGGNKQLPSHEIDHYSNEDLAEAFSYILKLHNNELGIINKHFQHIDESATQTNFYWNILIESAKICQYKEAEILLDGFPYQAIDNQSLKIEAINPRLEQSIRLGYIQAFQQMIIRRLGLEEHIFNKDNEHRPASIRKFAEEFYTAGKDEIISIVKKPIPRYVMKYILDPVILKPFSTDELFEEEIEALVQLGLENYDYGILKDVEIKDGITALDIMKVQRFFRFASTIFQCALADHPKEDRYVIALRSVLPTFGETQLKQLIELIIPNRDPSKILDLISLDLSDPDHIDIQYTPLLKLNGHYLASPAIIANSNLARNIFCAHRIKQPFIEKIDPMQSKIASALKEQGFQVAQEVNILFQKKEMETDIVAFKDGHLFLIECKNSYHPCNVHEMRNSFDQISYGAHQLNIRKAWLMDTEEQKRLFSKAKFTYQPIKEIHTCIALANRVFNGYNISTHPVRQGHEFINMITTGKINIAGKMRNVWKTTEFSPNDLIAYLSGDTILDDCFKSLTKTSRTYTLKNKDISFSTYTLDPEQLSKISERHPEIS
ncbi:hypothetical protein [Pseudomonas sp. NPDC087639]|uniref:hypothetical protein n=1 Tax=Pseudomonas sp. NPDC087639 TaxID=3364445 RepID=UPI00380F3AC5